MAEFMLQMIAYDETRILYDFRGDVFCSIQGSAGAVCGGQAAAYEQTKTSVVKTLVLCFEFPNSATAYAGTYK